MRGAGAADCEPWPHQASTFQSTLFSAKAPTNIFIAQPHLQGCAMTLHDTCQLPLSRSTLGAWHCLLVCKQHKCTNAGSRMSAILCCTTCNIFSALAQKGSLRTSESSRFLGVGTFGSLPTTTTPLCLVCYRIDLPQPFGSRPFCTIAILMIA